MNTKLTTQPPKGTRDWLPEEYAVRKYIFDTWRRVCLSFGYEEYLTPIIESADIYRAKSGEDIGGKELMAFTDKAGRELAIRPEMTPSVTRMVSGIYNSAVKPLRLFSIANFFRNEKPQRGRNREFWQLNADIFGAESALADLEILQMALEIMLSFNPPAGSFTLLINNRKLIDYILSEFAGITQEQSAPVVRILDKWAKLPVQELEMRLLDLGLVQGQIEKLRLFMQSQNRDELVANVPSVVASAGFQEIDQVLNTLTELGYSDWIRFTPNVIRGFDYYDGIIFEVFDNNPDNSRAMFGGGRYNGLSQIFGVENLPATGCAPGDEPTRLFLESWGLLERARESQKQQLIYLPLLSEAAQTQILKLANTMRKEGVQVITSTGVEKLGKALELANKKSYSYVIILGEDEQKDQTVTVKNMQSGEQKTMAEGELVTYLLSSSGLTRGSMS